MSPSTGILDDPAQPSGNARHFYRHGGADLAFPLPAQPVTSDELLNDLDRLSIDQRLAQVEPQGRQIEIGFFSGSAVPRDRDRRAVGDACDEHRRLARLQRVFDVGRGKRVRVRQGIGISIGARARRKSRHRLEGRHRGGYRHLGIQTVSGRALERDGASLHGTLK